MFFLFIIYFRLNFDIVVANYTDDGSLELGSERPSIIIFIITSNYQYF